MQTLFSTISKIAPSSANILVQGESGTGKELIARAIHQASHRAQKPFRAINCAALPAELLESELFGHKKGSFTGADTKHVGLFEASHGGTIFLDEIGDMPPSLQPKLLRVLQDSCVRPVGDNDEIKVDVRIIAATHENLEQLVAKKKFRDDLYFRLNVVPLQAPPLRERLEDVEKLTYHFVKKFSLLHSKKITIVDASVTDIFRQYHWPGNIRELENSIERAILLSESEILCGDDFSWITKKLSTTSTNANPEHSLPTKEYFRIPLGVSLKELETSYIKAYSQAFPNLTQEDVAHGLGINRKTLYRKFAEMA